MAKGKVWNSPKENNVITPRSPIDKAAPIPKQKPRAGKTLGIITFLKRLKPLILRLSASLPRSFSTAATAGTKQRSIKGKLMVAFTKITSTGVKYSKDIRGFTIRKIPVPITIGEEAKIKILRISIYFVESLNLLAPTQVEIINAITIPKNPEVIDRKNEFNAAR